MLPGRTLHTEPASDARSTFFACRYHLGQLKAKLAKLRTQLQEPSSKVGRLCRFCSLPCLPRLPWAVFEWFAIQVCALHC